LYSPGHGAGWTTWICGGKEAKQFALTYEPIIEFLEGGGSFTHRETEVDWNRKSDLPQYVTTHPILKQFSKEFHDKFGEYPYMGGAHNLKVADVDGEVLIEEYDGYESYRVHGDDEGWL
jgi:hypothetical protein